MRVMNSHDFEKLKQAYTLSHIALHQLQERVLSLEEENARLKELLRLQQERLFGKKSESSKPTLPLLTSTEEKTQIPAEPASEPKTTVVASHVRSIPKRGNRQFSFNELPRYTVIHDLAESEKKCACCGGTLHLINREKSEQLEIIPVQY